LAQAGEGSVRDSLSALDQAIACCGSELHAAEVRALLGAFSLESLETVTQALASGDSQRMLEVVDELERNGHNLQHFSRELSRYFRNLLVARISGSDTRLVAASPAQRAKMAEIAAQFSEEDLTRYLKLSLDLFSDLQESLQPRFHLELGLVRMVHAGRLVAIEEALGNVSGGAAPVSQPPKSPAPTPMATPKAAPAPAPKAAPAPPPPPQNSEWRQRLHSALMELGMPFTADAIANSAVSEANGELEIVTTKLDKMALREDELQKAIKQISSRPFRIKIRVDEKMQAAAPLPSASEAQEDDTTKRALANPEVQRFRDVFDGKIYKVRNLKE
jgi:DNA polymerase-3 subunit gamma/tau